jgi:transposase
MRCSYDTLALAAQQVTEQLAADTGPEDGVIELVVGKAVVQVLGQVLVTDAPTATPEDATDEPAPTREPTKRGPARRRPLPPELPRIHVEVIPHEVQRAGLDAFERIGEETSEVVEHRSASLVVVRIVRPKFVRARSSDTPPPMVPPHGPVEHHDRAEAH